MQQKWNEYWKQLESCDKDLTEFLEDGCLSTIAVTKSKKFLKAWNKSKKIAEQLDQFITPVEPLQVTIPFRSKEFDEMWKRWKGYIQEQHGQMISSRSELSALEHLENLSKKNETKAVEMLRYAMANRYRNFFAIDEKDNNQPPKTEGTKKSDWD